MPALSRKAKKQREANNVLKELLNRITFALLVLAVVCSFFPEAIPYTFFDLWKVKEGGPADWIIASWPVLFWVIGVTSLCFLTRNRRDVNKKAEEIFVRGTLTSLFAGVVEEICFRWILFLQFIVMAKVTNYVFLGFMGHGIIEAIQVHILGPVANFFTFGYLGEFLGSPTNWAIGAAILSANALFRNGHKYLGPVGILNSWFIGMFMFILLFKFGLLACILVHFLYDFLIAFIRYVDMVIERKLGLGVSPRGALASLLEEE